MSKKNRKTRMGRVLMKRKRESSDSETEKADGDRVVLPPTRSSDEPAPKKAKWINRQRVLVVAARGTTERDRHLMNDLKSVMPHCRPENKISRREHLMVINELSEMKNCNKAIFLESRKKLDLYIWISNVPHGPSAKFLVENVATMKELRMTGNCLKGSRPLLSFDENFDKFPHYAILKEIFIQVFGVPNYHPKSQPFVDRVVSFTILDNRIWYRHYQILKEDGALAEIGPRFILNPIKIFEASFGGAGLWENPDYVSPTLHRQRMSAAAGVKYLSRQQQRITYRESRPEVSYPSAGPADDIFEGDPLTKAAQLTGEELPDELKEFTAQVSAEDSESNNKQSAKKKKQKVSVVSFKKKKRGGRKLKKKTVST